MDSPESRDGALAFLGKFRNDEERDTYLTFFEKILNDPDITDIRQKAYVLATVWWETARTFKPIAEYFPKGQEMKTYFNAKYSGRHDLGNNGGDSGSLFRGRGYCQITGLNNYRRFAEILGVDLLGDPDLALEPQTAYKILVLGMTRGLFTGKRLDQYIRGPVCNYVFARQIINRFDQAKKIARAAELFAGLLKEVSNAASS